MNRAARAIALALLFAASYSASAQQNALKITSQPGSAQVYLDDAPKGTTSPDEGKLVLENLPTGTHKLRIGLSGYTDWIQSVTLTDGSTLYIDAKLAVAGPLPFTSQDVLDLLKGGVSAKRAADLVKERGVDFTLTDAIEKEVRAAGGDDALLLAVTKAKAPPPPSPPPAVAPSITLFEPAGAENGGGIPATGSTLRLRGAASHPSGIASISVDGRAVLLKRVTPENVEFDVPNLSVGAGSEALVVIATATDRSEVQRRLPLAPQAASRPVPLPSGAAATSASFENFQHDAYRINYPANWQVIRDKTSSVTIAPPEGVSGPQVSLGVIINLYQPRGRVSLDEATLQLTNFLLRANPGMKAIGQAEDIRVNGVFGKSVHFALNSPTPEDLEHDWVVALQRPDGSLLYLVFVAPEHDFEQMRPTFQVMLRTLHLTPTTPPGGRE